MKGFSFSTPYASRLKIRKAQYYFLIIILIKEFYAKNSNEWIFEENFCFLFHPFVPLSSRARRACSPADCTRKKDTTFLFLFYHFTLNLSKLKLRMKLETIEILALAFSPFLIFTIFNIYSFLKWCFALIRCGPSLKRRFQLSKSPKWAIVTGCTSVKTWSIIYFRELD